MCVWQRSLCTCGWRAGGLVYPQGQSCAFLCDLIYQFFSDVTSTVLFSFLKILYYPKDIFFYIFFENGFHFSYLR